MLKIDKGGESWLWGHLRHPNSHYGWGTDDYDDDDDDGDDDDDDDDDEYASWV